MTLLTTNWITKLVTLVEDNPLVKTFEDVDLVLTTTLGKDNVTVVRVSNNFPKLQIEDVDTKMELLAPFSKTYEVSVDKEVFGILVENYGSNRSPKYIEKLLFNETNSNYVTTLLWGVLCLKRN